MQKTKWATHEFTKDQKKARAIWRRAEKQYFALFDALMLGAIERDRKALHKALDRRLDAIDKAKTRATEIFPEVGESFTVASMTVQL